jgi:predicted ester cyclase
MGMARTVAEQALRAIETRERQKLGTYFTPDVSLRMPGVEISGFEQLRGLADAYSEAFPDLYHEIVRCVETDDAVVLELRVTGTHTGTLRTVDAEIAATGHAIDYRAADVFWFAGDKIASWHAYFDQLTFLVQLGLAPARVAS